jgi:hypothetical protein
VGLYALATLMYLARLQTWQEHLGPLLTQSTERRLRPELADGLGLVYDRVEPEEAR